MGEVYNKILVGNNFMFECIYYIYKKGGGGYELW